MKKQNKKTAEKAALLVKIKSKNKDLFSMIPHFYFSKVIFRPGRKVKLEGKAKYGIYRM